MDTKRVSCQIGLNGESFAFEDHNPRSKPLTLLPVGKLTQGQTMAFLVSVYVTHMKFRENLGNCLILAI